MSKLKKKNQDLTNLGIINEIAVSSKQPGGLEEWQRKESPPLE